MDPALQSMIKNLEEKTGRPMDEWVALLRASGLKKHGEMVSLLKSKHGFTHGYANLVAHAARDGIEGPESPVEDQEAALFAGRKMGLRPVYDALKEAFAGLGGDVVVSPKKTYVSFRRKKQFALVQPSTASRLDLGLNLKGVDAMGRLESAAGFNAMCTHRVRLEGVDQVDYEVEGWIRQAYEAAG